jgi:hypothetical protein
MLAEVDRARLIAKALERCAGRAGHRHRRHGRGLPWWSRSAKFSTVAVDKTTRSLACSRFPVGLKCGAQLRSKPTKGHAVRERRHGCI